MQRTAMLSRLLHAHLSEVLTHQRLPSCRQAPGRLCRNGHHPPCSRHCDWSSAGLCVVQGTQRKEAQSYTGVCTGLLLSIAS